MEIKRPRSCDGWERQIMYSVACLTLRAVACLSTKVVASVLFEMFWGIRGGAMFGTHLPVILPLLLWLTNKRKRTMRRHWRT